MKTIIGYVEANKSREFCSKVINDINMTFENNRKLIMKIENLLQQCRADIIKGGLE